MDNRGEKPDESEPNHDDILDHAIEYCIHGSYPPGLTKDKKEETKSCCRERSISDQKG